MAGGAWDGHRTRSATADPAAPSHPLLRVLRILWFTRPPGSGNHRIRRIRRNGGALHFQGLEGDAASSSKPWTVQGCDAFGVAEDAEPGSDWRERCGARDRMGTFVRPCGYRAPVLLDSHSFDFPVASAVPSLPSSDLRTDLVFSGEGRLCFRARLVRPLEERVLDNSVDGDVSRRSPGILPDAELAWDGVVYTHLANKASVVRLLSLITNQQSMAAPCLHSSVDPIQQPLERPILAVWKTDVE